MDKSADLVARVATPAELEILQVLWPLSANEAKRLAEIHEAVGRFRTRHEQATPAITTVSSTLRGALQKGLLREVRLVGGKVNSAPGAGRGLVVTRSPQTAYQAAVSAVDVLLPMLQQLVRLCPSEERGVLLLALLKEFELPDEVAGKVERLLK